MSVGFFAIMTSTVVLYLQVIKCFLHSVAKHFRNINQSETVIINSSTIKLFWKDLALWRKNTSRILSWECLGSGGFTALHVNIFRCFAQYLPNVYFRLTIFSAWPTIPFAKCFALHQLRNKEKLRLWTFLRHHHRFKQYTVNFLFQSSDEILMGLLLAGIGIFQQL